MTATAQIDDDQLVSQPDHGTIFLSRRSELRLVKTPRYPIRGASGQQVGEKPGEVIPFREGRFYCPADGVVTLEDGREVDANEIRDWLNGHRRRGDVEEGFWAVETIAPPISAEESQALTDAATDWDVDTLQRLIEQERAGWGREDLIRVAEGAIVRIERKEAEVRAQIEAEQEEQSAKPAAKAKPKPAAE